MSPKPRLYTFAISHFSEKIRWTLDAVGVDYEEVVWTPVLHLGRALLKARRATTVPILEIEGEVVQDSTRILMWLEQHRAPFALLPAEDEARQAVLEIEQRFDQTGKHVLRYLYDSALRDPEGVQEMWTVQSSPLEKQALSVGFPLIEKIFRRRFKISPREVARSQQVIAHSLSWLEKHRRADSLFLHDDRPSVADITAAALLAPVACPAEHPIYGLPRYRQAVAEAIAVFGESPALDWVRRFYQEYRHHRLA
jgi:glutathione S-transferase